MFDIQPYEETICLLLYHQGYTKTVIYVIQPVGAESVDNVFCDMNNVAADDCLQWYEYCYFKNDQYKIRLSNGTTVDVLCNQTGGGWTVIQHRRICRFYRRWTEYVNGFGNISGKYWLGLEAIYLLAKWTSSFRIGIETFGDVEPSAAYALYNEFARLPASEYYRLSIGSFIGNCGDSLSYRNDFRFTTSGRDNDVYSDGNCADMYKGALWYRDCIRSNNLNGYYYGGNFTGTFAKGIVWSDCWGYRYILKACSIQLRRN